MPKTNPSYRLTNRDRDPLRYFQVFIKQLEFGFGDVPDCPLQGRARYLSVKDKVR